MADTYLSTVRANAGHKGGLISSITHPKSKQFLSAIGKRGGRPRNKTIEELLEGRRQ